MAYPPIFDANGYTGFTQAELVTYWTARFQANYGADVNLNSNTPDGNMMNDFIQAMLDQQDVSMQMNASFDPDQCIGVTQDQRYAINGIQRQGGTFSTININVVTSKALLAPLNGLDALISNPNATVYTVSDGAGTQWKLKNTTTISAAGTTSLVFQAAKPGQVLAQANTIVNPVTIVVGVTSVNNPAATADPNIGVNEESAALFRARRQKSVSIAAKSLHDSMVAVLENIPGVTYVKVYENDTGLMSDGTTPAGVPAGIPRNTIWAVINGPSDATTRAAIANAIYQNRAPGPGTKGAQQKAITQADGTTFYVYWDYVTPQRTYVTFNAHSINGTTPIDTAYIAQQLALNFKPAIGATLDGTSFGTAVQEIDPNCLVTNVEFSIDNSTFRDPLPPTAANYQFTIAAADVSISVV